MMTPEQRKSCRDLIITPWHKTGLTTKEEFLRQFPSSVEDGHLAAKVLDEAYRARSAEELQCALIIGFKFGFSPSHINTLCHLIDADWHQSHEDVVAALDKLQTSSAIEALYRATQWIPSSLEYDDSRAFAVKAIWALGRISSPDAETKLEMLAHADDPILQKTAMEQLERRNKAAREN